MTERWQTAQCNPSWVHPWWICTNDLECKCDWSKPKLCEIYVFIHVWISKLYENRFRANQWCRWLVWQTDIIRKETIGNHEFTLAPRILDKSKWILKKLAASRWDGHHTGCSTSQDSPGRWNGSSAEEQDRRRRRQSNISVNASTTGWYPSHEMKSALFLTRIQGFSEVCYWG